MISITFHIKHRKINGVDGIDLANSVDSSKRSDDRNSDWVELNAATELQNLVNNWAQGEHEKGQAVSQTQGN